MSDCEALLASRDALAGEGTLNWDPETPMGDWDGVHFGWDVRGVTRVTQLLLEDSGLTGHIPAVLGSLRFLRILGLQNNQLSGPIPPELGAARELYALHLRGNRLTGTIPPALGSLHLLNVLSLGNNQLTGRIPPTLESVELRALDLSNNQLSGPVPPMRASFDRLEHVALHGNPGLTGCLTVSRAGARQAVREAGLQECPPTPSPSELCGNGTTVPDPADNPALVADCAALLTILDPLAGEAALNWAADRPITSWEGIKIGGDPPRVVTLALPSRGLTGHLPPWLGWLSGLRELRLEDNHLSGIILVGLGRLESLTSLSLNGNRLIGPIPAGLGGLLHLESLHLHDNHLSGPIPATLTYPRTLRRLSLRGNTRLSGCVPPALQEVPENDVADLAHLVCAPPPPPAEVCESGTVVPEPAGNPGLVADCVALLDARAAFVSDVPLNWDSARPITEWEGITIEGMPRRVQGLDLWVRRLTGHIPPHLGRLVELRNLSLAGNRLFGPIPAELSSLHALQSLDLRSNHLSGSIPRELGDLRGLAALRLQSNRLADSIPAELGNLAALQALDLAFNRLSGPIPAELGSLAALRSLDLASNRLSGPIPGELGSLAELRTLDLSSNELRGAIPADAGIAA